MTRTIFILALSLLASIDEENPPPSLSGEEQGGDTLESLSSCAWETKHLEREDLKHETRKCGESSDQITE